MVLTRQVRAAGQGEAKSEPKGFGAAEMRRVEKPVTLAEAQERLQAYSEERGPGPFKASQLADVIWPNTHWRASQGAGAAAVRILKRLGYKLGGDRVNWGWYL